MMLSEEFQGEKFGGETIIPGIILHQSMSWHNVLFIWSYQKEGLEPTKSVKTPSTINGFILVKLEV